MGTPVTKLSGLDSPEVSPEKERLQKTIEDVIQIQGLAFLSLINKNGLYVFPSQRNFAGGILFRDLIADSGCAGYLMKIHDTTVLDEIFKKYGDKTRYYIGVGDSTTANGAGHTLVVDIISTQDKFDVKIGTDLFGDAVSTLVSQLRFQLSSEAAKYILANDAYKRSFSTSDTNTLIAQANANVPCIPVSLVGNVILDRYSEVKYQGVRYYFDARRNRTVDFVFLSQLSREILKVLGAALKEYDALKFDESELQEERLTCDF